jgi:ABC-type amino acid transport substrate-binding protein
MGYWLRATTVTMAMVGVIITGCSGTSNRVAVPAARELMTPATDQATAASVTTLAAIERRGQLRVILDWSNPSFFNVGDINGFAFELSQRIAQIIFGDKVKVEYVHSLVRPRDLQRGDGDLLFDTWQPTGDELKTFHVSPPYYTDSARLLVPIHAGITKVQQLDGKTVAEIVNTYWDTPPDRLPRYLQQAEQNLKINFKQFTFFKDGVDAVGGKEIAAVSGPTTELAKFVKENPYVTLLPERYQTWTYGVVVVKQNTELSAAVDKAIQQMKASGELDQLVKKWGLDI